MVYPDCEGPDQQIRLRIRAYVVREQKHWILLEFIDEQQKP